MIRASLIELEAVIAVATFKSFRAAARELEGLALQAALAGAGLAYVSERAAAADIEAGRLARVLAAWTPPFPGLRLFHPSNRLVRAALRAFIGIVRASTADRGRRGKAGRGRSA